MQSYIQLKSNPETSENASGVSLDYLSYLQKRKSRPGGQLLDACASVVRSGGGGENRTPVRKRSALRRYILSRCSMTAVNFHRQTFTALAPKDLDEQARNNTYPSRRH